MAELPSPFVCDVCGVHKGEQNHWFKVWKLESGVIVIANWAAVHSACLSINHCCGEEHALRKAGELLAGLKGKPNERTTPAKSAD